MQTQIKLNNQELVYDLKVSQRAKRMRIAIYCDGAVVVTAPNGVNGNLIEQFILRKARWIFDKLDYFKARGNHPFVRSGKGEFLKYKQEALVLAKSRVEYFNEKYGFKFNKINIRNQKTRWGSCSRKGNLNFNYKIALLPEHLADYIIVHELCHLREFNHSKKFWNLVAQEIPDYAQHRKEINNTMQ